jgi:hypothetical protein
MRSEWVWAVLEERYVGRVYSLGASASWQVGSIRP